MNDDRKQRIRTGLAQGRFGASDTFIDVSDGDEDCVHIVIVSRQFDDLSYQEKEDLLWDELTKHVSEDDQRHVTLLVGVSPEEVKAY